MHSKKLSSLSSLLDDAHARGREPEHTRVSVRLEQPVLGLELSALCIYAERGQRRQPAASLHRSAALLNLNKNKFRTNSSKNNNNYSNGLLGDPGVKYKLVFAILVPTQLRVDPQLLGLARLVVSGFAVGAVARVRGNLTAI